MTINKFGTPEIADILDNYEPDTGLNDSHESSVMWPRGVSTSIATGPRGTWMRLWAMLVSKFMSGPNRLDFSDDEIQEIKHEFECTIDRKMTDAEFQELNDLASKAARKYG